MESPQIDIIRGRRPSVELRADETDEAEGRTMVGHFSVFDTWYEVNSYFEGHFLERTAPGAFRETMAEDGDQVKVTFNHGFDVLGDQILGDVADLREDGTGAYYEVPLFRGVPDLLMDGLRAGVYGSSFRFRVTGESWDDEPGESDHNPAGLPERTITKVRLFEFGPVTFPANPDATAGLRCMTDQFYEALRQRRPSAFDEAVEACRAVGREIPTGRVDPWRTTGGGSGDEPTPAGEEPAPTRTSLSREVRHRDLRIRGVIQ